MSLLSFEKLLHPVIFSIHVYGGQKMHFSNGGIEVLSPEGRCRITEFAVGKKGSNYYRIVHLLMYEPGLKERPSMTYFIV